MVQPRILRRPRLSGGIVGESVGAGILERRQFAVAAAFARLAQLLIIVSRRRDQRLTLSVGHDRRSDANRAARVEHVDHRPFVCRVDAKRRVRLARGGPADQQRRLEIQPLHFARDRHHLVQ